MVVGSWNQDPELGAGPGALLWDAGIQAASSRLVLNTCSWGFFAEPLILFTEGESITVQRSQLLRPSHWGLGLFT